jgi:hypothetical protein
MKELLAHQVRLEGFRQRDGKALTASPIQLPKSEKVRNPGMEEVPKPSAKVSTFTPRKLEALALAVPPPKRSKVGQQVAQLFGLVSSSTNHSLSSDFSFTISCHKLSRYRCEKSKRGKISTQGSCCWIGTIQEKENGTHRKWPVLVSSRAIKVRQGIYSGSSYTLSTRRFRVISKKNRLCLHFDSTKNLVLI